MEYGCSVIGRLFMTFTSVITAIHDEQRIDARSCKFYPRSRVPAGEMLRRRALRLPVDDDYLQRSNRWLGHGR